MLGRIREQARAWRDAYRLKRNRRPKNPDRPDLEYTVASKAEVAAFSELKRMLQESGALTPRGWSNRTLATLHTLLEICYGEWAAPNPDDFSDLEADIEALGTDLPSAGPDPPPSTVATEEVPRAKVRPKHGPRRKDLSPEENKIVKAWDTHEHKTYHDLKKALSLGNDWPLASIRNLICKMARRRERDAKKHPPD
jgi:hypothetical protein